VTGNESLFTPRKHVGQEEVTLHFFLNSAMNGGEQSVSRPGCFSLAENAPFAQ